MHGQGTLFLTNGEKYTGYFDEGMVNGSGVFTTTENQEIVGNWNQGQLVMYDD